MLTCILRGPQLYAANFLAKRLHGVHRHTLGIGRDRGKQYARRHTLGVGHYCPNNGESFREILQKTVLDYGGGILRAESPDVHWRKHRKIPRWWRGEKYFRLVGGEASVVRDPSENEKQRLKSTRGLITSKGRGNI